MTGDVWRRHAAQWERVGGPLRPVEEDAAFYGRAITASDVAPRALVLGVTPELARLPWPTGTSLLAIDRNHAMIREVWPGYPGPGQGALCADWTTVSLPRGARDLVVSDGCFGVLPYTDGYPALLRSLDRACTPDYRFVFRVFVQPASAETPRAVIDAALAGQIGSFHAFKLRLLMATQASVAEGVAVDEVWSTWSREGLTPEDVEAQVGWPADQVRTIEAYRGERTRYTFPTRAALESSLEAGGLVQLEVSQPEYELGERCLRYVYRRAQPPKNA